MFASRLVRAVARRAPVRAALSARAVAAFARPTAAARYLSVAAEKKFEYILTDRKGTDGRVALVTLNRPKALNALCDGLMLELNAHLRALDADPKVGTIVITGSEKAFAAGADIKEMSGKSYMDAYKTDMLAHWHDLTRVRKPIIAAVNGFALGGGCELAMMCDIVLAGDKAKFGQPEVKIGTIPGCGGTQRLTRAVGKSRAMEWILLGDMFTAEEAAKAGLVSRVIPAAQLLQQAVELADKIAARSKPIIALAKESVNAAYNNTLDQGVVFERRLFHSTFATNDQKQGMSSFAAKKEPQFTDS